MAKKLAPVEVNSFVGGLISDANALTFPPNASVAEDNMVLNSDGSRNRRLGMDFEDEAISITTSVTVSSTVAHTTYKWENVGGDPEKTFLVVQFGNELKFFDFNNTPLSSEVIKTHLFSSSSATTQYSYAVVDGILIVVTGEKEVTIFTYADDTITSTVDYIRIRDLFGVEDKYSGGTSGYLLTGVVSTVAQLPSSAADGAIYKILNGTAITSDDTYKKYVASVFSGYYTTETYNPSHSYVIAGSTSAYVGQYIVVGFGEEAVHYRWVDTSTPARWDDYTPPSGSSQEVDLKEGNSVSLRPSSPTDTHIYNLRNQSFGKSMVCSTTASREDLTKKDPIAAFYSQVSKYPSNADSVNQALYPDANMSSNRTIQRFFVEDLEKTPIGTTQVANGYFIIDAMERGTSRIQVYSEMMTKYPELTLNISALPLDRTVGGPSVVAQYAGRIWYGGFSGVVVEGDKKSPKLSSYVMFSQLVESPSDIVNCYQEGDPTSEEEPDLVDTDGGFIRIDEAFGIQALEVSGNSLFVLARNGVWRITGNAKDEGFTATNYSVGKISEVGCIGPSTVVSAEGAVYFWGEDGIYAVGSNEYGDWVAKSLTKTRIQNFYNSISSRSKEYAKGFYDSYEHKVKWLYDNILVDTDSTRELVLDLNLNAFYTNTIPSVPKLVGLYESPPFKFTPGTETVVVGGSTVTVGVNEVVIGTQTRQSSTREIGYIAVTTSSGNISYKFASYKDTYFLDWKSFDGVGVDAEAYLITGYLSGGDAQRQKQALMLTVYSKKTETGFTEDFVPINPSSVKMQVQWEWTNSANSNRWGKEFQAYRHSRLYIPEDASDSFEDGYEVVVTKNKIRGKGRVLSMKFRTEPGKDFHVLGWSFMLGIMTDV